MFSHSPSELELGATQLVPRAENKLHVTAICQRSDSAGRVEGRPATMFSDSKWVLGTLVTAIVLFVALSLIGQGRRYKSGRTVVKTGRGLERESQAC